CKRIGRNAAREARERDQYALAAITGGAFRPAVMKIDHVCIAVRAIDDSAPRLCELLGYREKTHKVTNTRHKVNVKFLQCEGSIDIKLIEPSDDDSPLWDFIRKGGGLHHLCFNVPDVTQACGELVRK